MTHNIWYISKYLVPPSSANVGARGFYLMREFVHRGHRCLAITSDSNQLATIPPLTHAYEIQEIDGVTVCWIRTLKYQKAKSLRRILSWIHFEWRILRLPPKVTSIKPDTIIVSSLSLLTILNGFRLRQKYRARLIFEIRDIWPLTLIAEGGFSQWNPFVVGLALVEWLGYKYSDEIVGTMPNLKEHVQHRLGYKRAVHCIPIGFDPNTLETDSQLPKAYINSYIPENKFIVGYAGSIGITNALDDILKCAAELAETSRIHFLIVGEGDLKAEYQSKFGHLSNLTFAPKVSKPLVPDLLRHADLLYLAAYPSKVWAYGQSMNKLVDYMLAGRPIVATYDGFQSMINDAACGTYVHAGDIDALKQTILSYAEMSAALRTEVGLRGRAWIIKERSYSKLASEYLKILAKP